MGGRTLNDHRCAAAGVVVSVMVFSGCGVHKHPPTITGPGIYHVVRPGQDGEQEKREIDAVASFERRLGRLRASRSQGDERQAGEDR